MGVLFISLISLPERDLLFALWLRSAQILQRINSNFLSVSKYTQSGGFAKIKGFQIIIRWRVFPVFPVSCLPGCLL